jgi:hypothetical protein
MKYILVNYYWGSNVVSNNGLTFGELAKRWKSNAEKLKIPHYIVYLPKLNGKYQRGINYKATFIKSMMKKFPGYAIVWSDVDMIFQKYPLLFENPYNVDFMAFNWNYDPAVVSNNAVDPYIFETNAEIFYFANNSRIYKFIDIWENALSSKVYGMCADDRILALMFHKYNMDKYLRCHWLPVEYLYIPQYFSHLKLENKAVIIHDSDLTTEEDAHKKGASKNRIPKDYNLQHKVRDQKHKMMYAPTSPHEQGLMKRMKKYGFQFIHKYKTSQFNAICKNPKQYVHLSDPEDIINLWKSHAHNCNVIVGKEYSKKIPFDTDIYTPHINGKKIKFPTKNAILYLHKSDGTIQLVKEWLNTKDKSIHSLANVFNNNINHYLNLRIN